MKKLLLVATVLVGGVAISQAGLNLSIGIGLPLPPLPRPAVVVYQPVPVCPPPVYVAPPVCAPHAVVYYAPVQYAPTYWHGGPQHWRGHGEWSRNDRNHNYNYRR